MNFVSRVFHIRGKIQTRKWKLRCIATWGRPTPRQSFFGFNYEAMHQSIKFQHNRAMHSWLIDDLANWWAIISIFAKFALHKTLTSLLDLATPIFWKRAIIWRSDDVFRRFFHYTDLKSVIISISGQLDLMTLYIRSGIIFTKFEVGQPIRSL